MDMYVNADTHHAIPSSVKPASTNGRIKRIVYEDPYTIRKSGSDFGVQREAQAIAFVRERTSIPVPKILRIQVRGDDSWILMQRISGTRLDLAWPDMNQDTRRETVTQLKSYLNQLRDLRPPSPGWIGSCSKEFVYDHRLNNGFPCGPFASVSEFHDYLVAPLKQCPRPELSTEYRKLFSDDYCSNFAHADMSYENILVDQRSGDVTGIIDWEMAGFWPEWWEYRKALFGGRYQQWWVNVVKDIMPQYEKELAVDMDLEAF